MNHLRPNLLLSILLLLGIHAYAQPKAAKAEALQLAQEAHALITQGEFEKAVQKYTFAQKLAPDNIDYQLGLAQAWFFTKEYDKAMELCQPHMSGRKAQARAFQLYGNCLDGKGMTYEALETYRAGLLRFPHAGMLYAEMGLVEAARFDNEAALAFWEKGIVAQPNLPSNYYFAAERLFAMGDFAWAANYAELFINLERKGDRVRDMSKLLLRCYEKAREFDYTKGFQWRFYQIPQQAAGIPPVYPAMQAALDQAFASEFTDTTSQIGIADLIEVRRFVCHLLPTQAPDDPAIGLWQWQQRIVKAGHWEAYTYWLLYDARPEEFQTWFENERAGYDAFESWFSADTFLSHAKSPVCRLASTSKRRR